MKNVSSIVVLCVFALAAAAVALARPHDDDDEKYTSQWDGLDIPEILGNEKLLTNYCNCLLDEGRCTSDAKELKSHVQEAMETDCKKCTESQRKGTRQVIRHLVKHKPEVWARLKAKYDPTGKYSAKYEEQLKTAVAED